MNKSQLIERIAENASVSKASAGRILDAFIDSVIDSLKSGEEVSLARFGTFSIRERSKRIGRNPQTGEKIIIPASKVPGFRAGKVLRDAVK